MTHMIEDFQPGPLDVYRKKASFNWKKLRIFLETEEIIKYQNALYEEFQKSPLFVRDNHVSGSFDEQRHLAIQRVAVMKYSELLSISSLVQHVRRATSIARIAIQLSPDSFIKFGVSDRLFTTSIMNMGTERHSKYIDDTDDGKIFGCYCLTEIGHGSNARGMRTTATYDKQKKVFVLNSPDFEAAKCWAGGLGQIATHGTVYAQLILNGTSYGLHAFIVPIRDPETLLPYPGLIVGDMGEKIGLNGIDNGFLLFQQYEIPRENLLNKIADVSEDGRYVTKIKDPNKRYGAALGTLSSGRVNIGTVCEALGTKALTIAIRYAAVRKQFGPEGEDEVPILEYQTHQHRLLPYLAAAYALRIFNEYLGGVLMEFSINAATGNPKEDAAEMGIEIHGISSASKPIAGWIMKECTQECRETCGGHGYLKVAGIGDIRNDHDANMTYEGENHVLIQQTANWLLKFWPSVLKREKISSPMHSVDFLTNGLDILAESRFNASTTEEMCNPNNIIKIYQWLVIYVLKTTSEKLEKETSSGKDGFWAKNDTQVYYAKTLGIVYIEHFLLQRMLITISEATDQSIRNVLTKLLSLYGLWSLEKHISILYRGEFAVGPNAPTLIQDSILKLCAELKDDAVSLIDVIAPPDFILKSALGASDGLVYKHLQDAFFNSKYGMSRPPWWQEIVNWKNLKNKL